MPFLETHMSIVVNRRQSRIILLKKTVSSVLNGRIISVAYPQISIFENKKNIFVTNHSLVAGSPHASLEKKPFRFVEQNGTARRTLLRKAALCPDWSTSVDMKTWE